MRIRFIVPGDIDTPTGGYHYDRAIIGKWRENGLDVDLVSLPGNYPFPEAGEREAALSIADGIGNADIAIVDGLAGGAAPRMIERLAAARPVIVLIHHPLALENGLAPEQAAILETLERDGLAFVKAVVTTSPATAKTVTELFGYPQERIHTVLPGVERGIAIPFRTRRPLRILSVGSISERKGHDILLHALARLRDIGWQLDIVGPSTFNPALLDRLRQIAHDGGIEERVHFHGAVEAATLDRLYRNADVFALASRYEGYGMAYAEAIVRGLPVVATTAGAIPDTVPPETGLLAPPGDIDAFCEALLRILGNDELRERKHKGALLAEPGFPTWEASAARFHDLLKSLI